MDDKETAKKIWKKTGFGILFVAACFIAMYILMEFHGDLLMVGIAAVLLMISAFLFLNAVFSDEAKKWIPQEVKPEEIPSSGDGEFRLKITKHMKEMESTQKELIDVLKKQNTLIQTQIENLEHEIYLLSEKQVNQAKAIIKFNKENARQLAISERETLEYVMLELKKAIEGNRVFAAGEVRAAEPVVAAEPVIVAEPPAAEQVVPVLEEISEEALFAVSDLPEDDEFVMPEPPEMPEDIDLSELFDLPELFDASAEEASAEELLEDVLEEEASVEEVLEDVLKEEVPAETAPVVEEKAEEEAPAPAADPLAGFGADPNAMMTSEDIEKLLEAMGQ